MVNYLVSCSNFGFGRAKKISFFFVWKIPLLKPVYVGSHKFTAREKFVYPKIYAPQIYAGFRESPINACIIHWLELGVVI